MVLSKFSDTFVTREAFVRCLIVVSKLQQEVHLKNEGTIKIGKPMKHSFLYLARSH